MQVPICCEHTYPTIGTRAEHFDTLGRRWRRRRWQRHCWRRCRRGWHSTHTAAKTSRCHTNRHIKPLCDRLRVITEYSLGASRRGRDIMNLSKQLCESQALLGASKCSETDSEVLQVLLQVPLVTVCPAPPSAPRQNSKIYRHDAANAFHSLSVIPLRHGTQPLYRSSVPCRNLPRKMSETF